MDSYPSDFMSSTHNLNNLMFILAQFQENYTMVDQQKGRNFLTKVYDKEKLFNPWQLETRSGGKMKRIGCEKSDKDSEVTSL